MGKWTYKSFSSLDAYDTFETQMRNCLSSLRVQMNDSGVMH